MSQASKSATDGHELAKSHDAASHEGEEHHQEFNWVHGFIGEKEGVEPSLLWREPGTPAPFGGLLLNTALLLFLFVKMGASKMKSGLKARRRGLLAGIETAATMQSDAQASLDHHQKLLDNLEAEVERVKVEMRQAAKDERKRFMKEAVETRERLEQEARKLVEQELSAAKESLMRQAALAALSEARKLLSTEVSADDDRKICDEYVRNLPSSQGLSAQKALGSKVADSSARGAQ